MLACRAALTALDGEVRGDSPRLAWTAARNPSTSFGAARADGDSGRVRILLDSQAYARCAWATGSCIMSLHNWLRSQTIGANKPDAGTMVEYRTRVKRYLELWFDEPELPGRYDVVVRQRAQERGTVGRNEDFYSLHIDLSQDLEEILRGFSQNTRAEIKRSVERDALQFEFIDNPSADQLQRFVGFYDEFAREKGLEALRRQQIEAYRRSGRLCLSRVFNTDGTLTWHSTLSYGEYVGLVHSASHFRAGDSEFRKLTGRANRHLHWKELQHFRTKGFRVFDLGGWYAGSTDAQKLRINTFKEGFGGKKVLEFTVTENRSLLAKSLAALHYLWH